MLKYHEKLAFWDAEATISSWFIVILEDGSAFTDSHGLFRAFIARTLSCLDKRHPERTKQSIHIP